jgi:hypothetical protein
VNQRAAGAPIDHGKSTGIVCQADAAGFVPSPLLPILFLERFNFLAHKAYSDVVSVVRGTIPAGIDQGGLIILLKDENALQADEIIKLDGEWMVRRDEEALILNHDDPPANKM